MELAAGKHDIRRIQPSLRASRPMFAIALALMPSGLFAQAATPDAINELRAQIAALKAEQTQKIAEIERQTAERIGALEASLDRIEGHPPGSFAATRLSARDMSGAPAANQSVPGTASSAGEKPRLELSGDFRLRYESNFGDADARNRDRGVLRARLRAAYAISDWLAVGGQIATGDPDDPNSADITLSSFNDDLQVSLDQAYARMNLGQLQVIGGKIPQPFARTELVWDGDVSPQGVGATFRAPFAEGASFKAAGLYFLVDESVAGSNSDMVGLQLGIDGSLAADWAFDLTAAYYDYSLRSLAGADAGDLRSNLIGPGGRYLSDFDLVDGIAAITYSGLGDRWPVRLVGDYVKNLGAATSADTGYGVDLLVGRASALGDLRFGYGYAVAETDAVLAAFSHDNTNIATNYRQHTLSVDYVAWDNVVLNATWYLYRPKSAVDAGPDDPGDWLNRARLNFLVNF